MTLRIWILHEPQKTYFSQTIAPSDSHCFLLNNYLSKWNFLVTFHLKCNFRPMKIAPHSLNSLIGHWNEVFQIFRRFHLFELALKLRAKTRRRREFLNPWKLWILFVKFWKTLPKHGIRVTLRTWILHKPKKHKWCLLIPSKNSLARRNFMEIFYLND